MAKLKVSPLHRVIDARRWDLEALYGRLIIVVHAAMLDVGFVPCGGKSPNSGGLAEQVGRTASTLSLRYAAPQLAHREDATVLALCAAQESERHVVFYAHIDDTATAGGNARRAVYWTYVDVVALVPLLSGFLDDVARALRSDALGTRLWGALTDGFCRCLLSDLCSNNGVPLEPTFTSLPADIKLAILEKLTDGEDLARMECTSKEMRYKQVVGRFRGREVEDFT